MRAPITKKRPMGRGSSTAKLPKITYATLGMPTQRLHDAFDRALDQVKARLGKTHPMLIEGASPKEIEWFLDRIQAGVNYAKRQAGATTGAWPGYQAFGGWKRSGSTGKAGRSLYYLPQFMREQSRTVVS